jgi:hypothetical protein
MTITIGSGPTPKSPIGAGRVTPGGTAPPQLWTRWQAPKNAGILAMKSYAQSVGDAGLIAAADKAMRGKS